jgi:hypothetical protein
MEKTKKSGKKNKTKMSDNNPTQPPPLLGDTKEGKRGEEEEGQVV